MQLTAVFHRNRPREPMKRLAGSMHRRWNTADEDLPARPSALLDRDQRSDRANQGEMEETEPLLGQVHGRLRHLRRAVVRIEHHRVALVQLGQQGVPGDLGLLALPQGRQLALHLLEGREALGLLVGGLGLWAAYSS